MASIFAAPAFEARAVKILFFAELAFSPVVAAIALLVPVAAHWGAYSYAPAIVWFVIFVQCLVTFRWRGLWFLVWPPVAFLAIEAFLVAAPPVPKKESQAAGIEPGGRRAKTPGVTDTIPAVP
jgi:hypothetical protein